MRFSDYQDIISDARAMAAGMDESREYKFTLYSDDEYEHPYATLTVRGTRFAAEDVALEYAEKCRLHGCALTSDRGVSILIAIGLNFERILNRLERWMKSREEKAKSL